MVACVEKSAADARTTVAVEHIAQHILNGDKRAYMRACDQAIDDDDDVDQKWGHHLDTQFTTHRFFLCVFSVLHFACVSV